MREPEKTRELWFGDRLGGFEAPVPGKAPSNVSVPELKVENNLSKYQKYFILAGIGKPEGS